MKYNDNGEYKDIYVKAFDTLPVGAIVEYNGSTIPSGWTDIGNNQIQKTSQYMQDGASLSNEYGTSNENGYTQEYINSLNGKILWENSNPTSNMPNNTIINLLSDDYDILEIFYKYTTSNNAMWSKKIIKGYDAYLDIAIPYYTTSNQVANEYRTFIRNSDTQYTVSHCNITYTSSTSTTREDFIIPVKIIGYKL